MGSARTWQQRASALAILARTYNFRSLLSNTDQAIALLGEKKSIHFFFCLILTQGCALLILEREEGRERKRDIDVREKH